MSARPAPTRAPARAERFAYAGFEVDVQARAVLCRYRLDDHPFLESVHLPGGDWGRPAVEEAARLIFLLSGVSYYKAGAPAVIDLGRTPVRDGEREFLAGFYRDGLGEFAYRNGIEVAPALTGGRPAGARPPGARDAGPLIPFGGGIDSIVTVEQLRPLAPAARLFVVTTGGRRFAAIEAAAAVADLPVVRASRELDPALLRPRPGWLNGHVPVTGILSGHAVLAAVLEGASAVVMSNEWSSSAGNLAAGGRTINHQYSKSAAFEDAFRKVLAGAFEDPPEYFSLLRGASTPAIARRFAGLRPYHPAFRSCNRAFAVDPARRLDGWCGTCDKCCFVDLVLAPFLAPDELEAIFGGPEPLRRPELLDRFATLCGLTGPKPFECVGDTGECRAALLLAAARPDRREDPVVQALASRVEAAGWSLPPDRLLRPMGPDNVPERYAAAAHLG